MEDTAETLQAYVGRCFTSRGAGFMEYVARFEVFEGVPCLVLLLLAPYSMENDELEEWSTFSAAHFNGMKEVHPDYFWEIYDKFLDGSLQPFDGTF